MILGYIYLIICFALGLSYSIIGPNFLEYNYIWDQIFRVWPYSFNFLNFLNHPYNLEFIKFFLAIGFILSVLGFYFKNPRVRKNLLLIGGFLMIGFFLLYFGFMIGIFKEYIFERNGKYGYFY